MIEIVSVISSDKKRVYQVTETSCTCSDFTFRQAKIGGKCKHILKLFGTFESADDFELKESVKQFFKNGVDFLKAYEVYGDDIDNWLKQSLIVESKHEGKEKFYLLE